MDHHTHHALRLLRLSLLVALINIAFSSARRAMLTIEVAGAVGWVLAPFHGTGIAYFSF